VQLPRVGVVRLAENARRLERLVAKGRARVKSATVSLRAGKLSVSLQVEVLRPQANHRPAKPDSRVGIDLGTRWLAVVASADGAVLERVGMPAPLKASLTELRRLNRRHARSRKCSNRRHELKRQISAAHARVADIRGDALHKLTTRLAKTHGVIAIEDLHIAALMQQTGPGARARKQALADAALGELRRQLAYKCGWYGSRLVVADRWYPSSQTCHRCGHRQKIGRRERWTCAGCDTTHHRDDNAAINLARYEPDPRLREQARQGAQLSCRCGACPTQQAERLRDTETDNDATPAGASQPHGTAVPPTRRDGPQAVNPARGAKVAA